MEFSKLRLTGFKSFADPTELVIQPGLTGVVGPNGCGKSNLLEALRWVMGENSTKNMRASGMDDVIFAGSASRPGRNMAEVSIVLDNSSRTAPAAFNEFDTVEISRRIEHEAGSAYRINGKETRARDVQLLFADASTGARSPALVRQGQINEIISAKPAARRRILEEAAGITGLHTRRHEAQLRLNAAETNLTRLDDVTGQLDAQLANLKRQARQAGRYKKVSSDIRQAESILLYLRWAEAASAVELAEKELDEERRILGTRTQSASQALRAQNEAAERLPDLREKETIAAAVLQRLAVERDNLELEEKRAKDRKQELQTRLDQTLHDLARERDITGDTAGILAKLVEEERDLNTKEANTASAAQTAQAALETANGALNESEKVLDDASQTIAQIKAGQTSLERKIEELRARATNLEAEFNAAKSELGEKTNDDQGAKENASERKLDQVRIQAEQAEAAVLAAENMLGKARVLEAETREKLEDRRRLSQQFQTEIRTLTKVLNLGEHELWPPVIDALNVSPGWEIALGSALGDDLDVPLDDAAPIHWDELPDYDQTGPLPIGVTPLSDYVKAPPALNRRLGQVGIVTQRQGKKLQSALMPGQRLVSQEGDLWRWDGFTAAADAPTASALRLAERNRLDGLEAEAAGALREMEAAQSAFESAHAQVEDAQGLENRSRTALRTAHEALGTAHEEQVQLERAVSEKAARITNLKETLERLTQEKAVTQDSLDNATTELAALTQAAPADGDLDQLRTIVGEHRTKAIAARTAHDGLARDADVRQNRLRAISSEQASWRTRAENADAQIKLLHTRAETLATECRTLERVPDELAGKHKTLLDALGDAQQARNKAGDALVVGETNVADLTRKARQAEEELTETREAVARIGAHLEAARARENEFCGNILETLGLTPQEVPAAAEFDITKEKPASDDIEARLDKLRAERERLGAVNLRAEQEAVELSEQLSGLVHERDDLIKAIAKLRQGISSLNREGRERLLAAFDKVNENFERLFTHLFGGGEAKLELIEADDPLEAGLEIFARPPGKKLQALSLLSGGEQALTAISLIFAVFLTNPSPICVLDEVDASLDDANVQRFCNLIEEMVATTNTRYLIITHHPYTMSRADRLFGVTMGERGVSQLVSVDLETAERFLETG